MKVVLFQFLRSVKTLTAIAAIGFLAACASKVKLDDVPVADAKAQTVTGVQSVAPLNGVAISPGVAPSASEIKGVQLSAAPDNLAGPSGAAKMIYFDYDSYVVKPEFQAAIDAHAKFLSANTGRKMAIDGHTDERGGREYNLALGQRRAEAVRKALGLLGVSESQIEAVSFGKEKPADSALSEAAFAKNRRAEINYR